MGCNELETADVPLWNHGLSNYSAWFMGKQFLFRCETIRVEKVFLVFRLIPEGSPKATFQRFLINAKFRGQKMKIAQKPDQPYKPTLLFDLLRDRIPAGCLLVGMQLLNRCKKTSIEMATDYHAIISGSFQNFSNCSIIEQMPTTAK